MLSYVGIFRQILFGWDAKFFRHPYHLTQRFGSHLLHALSPTPLYGYVAGAQIGSVANFMQEVLKGQLPLSVRGLCGQGVELFGQSEAFGSYLDFHLAFLKHVYELDADEGRLRRVKRFEP